jgi:spermidine synthase
MIVEILGAKMLSPYLGMSHFVWTAQIAMTLVALASGYYVGGRLADRYQDLARLYWCLLAAAAYLVLSVLICAPVAYWCVDRNLAVGSLLASLILFFVPLSLLAMTGPFLVRTITSSVAGVGGNVGRLSSISTLGSFAGTILIGYLVIPLLPNSVTMYLTAMLLTLVCLGYFLVTRRGAAKPLLVILVVGSIGALFLWSEQTPSYQSVAELFRGNSHFGRLQVVENTNQYCRYYLNDNLVQNTYDPKTRQSESAFTYMLSGLARAYASNINDVLCIGLGVGIVPMDFARQGARVDVVEINPAVVPVARRFFGLEPDKLNITLDDARHFLNRCPKQYDAVALDAFLGDSSPSHLMTREAFEAIRRVLRPGGVLVINSFTELVEGHDYFANSLSKTLSSVFPGVRLHTQGQGAIFFAATIRPDPVFLHPPDFSHIHDRALNDTEIAFKNVVEPSPERGRVLTDDYNPIEFYDARNREAIRRRLAMSVKGM